VTAPFARAAPAARTPTATTAGNDTTASASAATLTYNITPETSEQQTASH